MQVKVIQKSFSFEKFYVSFENFLFFHPESPQAIQLIIFEQPKEFLIDHISFDSSAK